MSGAKGTVSQGFGTEKHDQSQTRPKRVGWTKEEAELSISGVPEVRVRANFDPDAFDVQEFAESLRRTAAAEAAKEDSICNHHGRGGEEGGHDNPFVLTLSELQQSSRLNSSSGVEHCSPEGNRGGVGRQADLGQQQGLEWDSEYDVILPERINQPASERFSNTQIQQRRPEGQPHIGQRSALQDEPEACEAEVHQAQGQVSKSIGSSDRQLRSHEDRQAERVSQKGSEQVSGVPGRAVTALPIPVLQSVDNARQQKVDDVMKCIDLMAHGASHDDGELWVRSCLRLQWLAETWPAARDLAHRRQCVTTVVKFMENHVRVVRVQSIACLVILSLCRNHSDNHRELDDANGLDQVMEAMRLHHDKDEDMAFNGTQCIAVMSVPGRHDEQLRKFNDLVSLVVDCMRIHLSNEGIQSAGCWALANMCCNEGIDQGEMKSFGLAAVLHAINQWSSSSMVMKEAIKALANMYHSDANRDNLLNSGALEEVPLALQKFSHCADVISTALISIATFSATDELRLQLCTHELVKSIVSNMFLLRQSSAVQEAGCWALANLVTSNTTPTLVECNVIPAVHSVLFREPLLENLQTMGCMLLYNIACSQVYRLDVVLAGAAKLAVNAIRRLVRNEKVVMAGVKLLTILSHESPPRQAATSQEYAEELQLGRLSVVQAAGVESLAAAMQVYDRDADVHNMALLAMHNLSDIAASHASLAVNSVMEVILQSSGVFRNQQSIVDKVLATMEAILISKQTVDVFITCGGLHIVMSLMDQYKQIVCIQTRSAVIMARVASSDANIKYWKSYDGSEGVPVSPLCSTSDDKSLCVAKAGGIWLIKSAMDAWRGNPPLQAAACQALTCLASSDIAADLMVKGDCISAITSAMLTCKEYELVQERGAAALIAVSNTSGFTAKFYRAHGDVAAIAAFKRFPKCEVIGYLVQHIHTF